MARWHSPERDARVGPLSGGYSEVTCRKSCRNAPASIASNDCMNLYVGTSGYSYKEWKGKFYPEDLPEKEMLRYYGERFNSVEINNTFYRMPKPSVLEGWAREVPANFKFVIKGSQKITHFQ